MERYQFLNMSKKVLLLLLLSSQLILSGQNIHLYRTIYFPASPYGGEKELKEFFKQEMVYPDSALDAEIEGKVFITFLINNQGKVAYKKSETEGNFKGKDLLIAEAERIFDRIIWVKDESRNNEDIGYEKLEVIFNRKKYLKLAKKREYHHLPFPEDIKVDSSTRYYSINEVDEKPQITNANSVNDYVKSNFKYPEIALQKGVSGRVTLDMIIEPYGIVSNVRVIDPVAGGCNEETIRLVKGMKWKAGMKNGMAVRTLYRYQLNFVNPRTTIR